jgi:hypothetical protein
MIIAPDFLPKSKIQTESLFELLNFAARKPSFDKRGSLLCEDELQQFQSFPNSSKKFKKSRIIDVNVCE